MKITKPIYFDSFRCIAGNCPDSCCKEWDVQVDEDAAAFYRALPGPLGDRLREVLKDEDGQTFMTIVDRRCPMWRDDGLCEIQAQHGHETLCRTCREFPRLTHDYGDFIEYGLELSCPEAARIILSSPAEFMTEEVPGGEIEYDQEAMAVLLRTRETARAILADADRPVGQTLALLLLYGYQAQDELDGAEEAAFDPGASLEAAHGDAGLMVEFFKELEILTPQWSARLDAPVPGPWQQAHLKLARYFVDRYWLQAVSDYDLVSRVKLAVVSCLLIRHLGGDLLTTAQIYSKEIENDADNVEALLDAAYTAPAFTDDRLLDLLLKIN
ncbi:MAG: flagellin lysine-N-methylase [Bacteroides sp.]|nr:flagellin lysine-N-methylase [Bacteroides sp.]